MNKYALTLEKRAEGERLSFATTTIRPSPAADECIEKNCPHITEDGLCPMWGPWDTRIKGAVVDEVWRCGGCAFYRWGKEE